MIRPMSQGPLAPAAPRRRPAASTAHRSATGYQRRWTRRAGALTLAGGLVLAMPGVQATDLNAAGVAELARVRGVGPKMAERIVKERQRGGPFESMEDLADRVRGIGWRKAQALRGAGLSAALGVAAPRPEGAADGRPPAIPRNARGGPPAIMRPGRTARQPERVTGHDRAARRAFGHATDQTEGHPNGHPNGHHKGYANDRGNGHDNDHVNHVKDHVKGHAHGNADNHVKDPAKGRVSRHQDRPRPGQLHRPLDERTRGTRATRKP